MRISDPAVTERVAKALTNSDARKIVFATIAKAKSAVELSTELELPVRSVYRYLEELCMLGLLIVERWALIDSGGKYALYRSMIKSVAIKYDSADNIFEVDLLPNEGILEKFMRFWSYMGR